MLGVNRFNLGSKSYVTIQNLYIEHNAAGNPAIAIVSTGDFVTIRNNVIFSYYLGGPVGAAILITAPAATGNNILIENNIIFGTAYGIFIILPNTASGVSGVVIRNCRISTNGWQNGVGIVLSASSAGTMASITISNCTITQFPSAGISINQGNVTDKHIIQNCIIGLGSTAINSTTSNQVTQRNNILLSQTNLANVATDASTITSDFFGIDYGQALLQGFGNLAPFSTSLNSRNTGFGIATSAPSTDLYGIAWTGATPDVGTTTYRSLQNIGFYLPTERNASTITIAPGSTSQSIELYLGAIGLTASTAGLSARYNRTRTASVDIPLVARTIGQAWISGGFAEVDAVNMPGVYRVDIPDAALAAGADDVTLVVRGASGTNGAVMTVKLSSGGLTSGQTASAVWGASVAGYIAETDFGGVVNATRSLVGDIPDQVWGESTSNHTTHGSFGWNILRADQQSKQGLVTLHSSGGINRVDADIHAIVNNTDAAIELKGALLHNGTDYISADLLSPTSPATTLRMGPYSVVADQTKQEINVDILTGASLPVVLQLVDANGTGIPLTGATLSVKIYTTSGTLVATYTGTASYADAGFVTFTLTSAVTATPGTYYVTVTRSSGATDTSIYGGLRLYVRSN
jgi:hypothetical protein